MQNDASSRLACGPDITDLSPGDPYFDLAQEMKNLIACRAYELFESNGSVQGRDREDWASAKAEILLTVPVDVIETETELTVRADVPGFGGKDLEVRVAATSLCISGTRQEESDPAEGKAVYSERRPKNIFRVLDLPGEIDPNTVNATVSNGILELRLSKVGLGKKVPVLTKAAAA
jgi:HSP20 family protein